MHLAKERPSLRLVTLVLVAGALLFTTPAVSADPAPGGPFTINHFNVWRDGLIEPVAIPVFLRDQFGDAHHDAVELEWFAVPVDKNQEGVVDPRAHLTWWRITDDGTFASRRVVVMNQFGDFTLDVFSPEYLLNPALKNAQPGTIEPLPDDTHDHYKCYRVEGDAVGAPVALGEQFGFFSDVVLEPLYLCNPAEKTDPAGNVFPIQKPEEHLVCYRTELPDPLTVFISATDQFGYFELPLVSREMVCVPSFKDEVVQTNEGTWGQLKSTYR